jgi:hypothetical protein
VRANVRVSRSSHVPGLPPQDNVLWLVFEYLNGDLWSLLESLAPAKGLHYSMATVSGAANHLVTRARFLPALIVVRPCHCI